MNKSLSILQMVGSIGQSVGGPPRSVSQLSANLVELGVRLSLMAGNWQDDPNVPLHPEIEFIPVAGRRLRIAGIRLADNFCNEADQHFGEQFPDIVHMHGLWLNANRQTAAYARKRGLPLVVAPRGMLEPWALKHRALKKKLVYHAFQRRDLQAASAFHATAQSEADSIRRLGFKQPIAVIPNGIVLPDLAGSMGHGAGSSPTPHDPRSMPKKRTALFLSRINPKKGLPMLLDAWKRVAPADWRLLIAGNDDSTHLPVVERKIRELGLSDRVEIAGPLFGRAQEAAYRNADLFVLPSYSENFGIVVAEALSYGVPVLTTTGCPWQELQAHNCGWWVDPTPVAIEAGLNEALRTKNEELSAMGRRGRRLVEANYQWPGIGERMQEFYQWVLNGGKQPNFVV